MKWLLAALGSLVLWGLWGVALRRAESLSNAWYQVYLSSNMVILAVIAAILALKGREALPPTTEGLLWALLAGAMGTSGFILLILSLKLGGEASVVFPLTGLYPALTAVLAFALLGEEVTPSKALGVALAAVAIILLSR